jgi:beta-N-acetylhexosaminidase
MAQSSTYSPISASDRLDDAPVDSRHISDCVPDDYLPGPLLIDLIGATLLEQEAAWLRSPMVSGVIFFARNYQSPDQFRALVQEIRRIAPHALLTVDQEGGRVQRFKQGLTRLPAPGLIARYYGGDMAAAVTAAEALGALMAAELAALDVDLSFAPVMDLDLGRNAVIGNRAFADDPARVTTLALAWRRGMAGLGMAAVAKHFPGHGYASADTHHESVIDERSFGELADRDLLPFVAAIDTGIEAMMPAHVIYPSIDAEPASRSPIWLQSILRQKLGFTGAIISDDLSMKGAAALPLEPRLLNSLEAGCDLLLLCNDPAQLGMAVSYLQTLPPELTLSKASVTRRLALKRKNLMTGSESSLQRQTAASLAVELLRFEATLA